MKYRPLEVNMLAIQRSCAAGDKCTANILPCNIKHTGPTKVTKRFWSPKVQSDGSTTSYFRGRKLKGRVIKLPEDYEGVLWRNTDKTVPKQFPRRPVNPYEDDDSACDEEEEALETVKVVDQISTFDNMLVWGHDQLPAESDVFVKGVEEWIRFAEAIHRPHSPKDDTIST